MGQAEVRDEQLALAKAIGEVIRKHRAEWCEDHGAGADYAPIALAGLTRASNELFVHMFKREHGRSPPMEHFVKVWSCDYPRVLIEDAGELLGKPVRTVEIDARMLLGLFDFTRPRA